MTGPDAVQAAIARAVDGLSAANAATTERLIREALAQIDAGVGPEDLAVEIDAALDVPVGDRVAAARRFAAHRQAFALGRRAWELLRAFTSGELPADAATTRATELSDDIDAAIDAAVDEDTRYQLGDYALEVRYVLSGGAGPISLRGAKLTR